jgi:hypothetical protein
MRILSVLIWFARILAILAILFMLMFSMDTFGGGESFGRQLSGFLVHSIPALLLIGALIVAWKFEIIGGVIFIIIAVALGIYWNSFKGNSGSLLILVPFLLTGLLFLLHGLLTRKSKAVK